MIDEIILDHDNRVYDFDQSDTSKTYKERGDSLKKIRDETATAIYEIGLEVIGEDTPEERAEYVRAGLMGLANQNLGKEMLRASQRQAWAKACGVEITNKEKDNG